MRTTIVSVLSRLLYSGASAECLLRLSSWLSLCILQKQPDYDRIDNDLKYRYIKMKGEASPNRIRDLENIFELNRNNNKIRQMREDVEAYEEAVHKRAAPCRTSPPQRTGCKGTGKQG